MKKSDPTLLPRRKSSGEPIPPCQQPGYYRGHSTLDQEPQWDEATRAVIEARVYKVPQCRFFSEDEQRTLQAVLDRVLPQDDRDAEHQVPILNHIDAKLFEKRFDGYFYEGKHEDDVAHRLGLVAIEATAKEAYKKSFHELSVQQQEEILLSARDEKPIAAQALWQALSGKHYWSLLLQDAASAYYAHPFAWDEIGFGGPAYPRGYMRLTDGQAEPWEKNEMRYEWDAPAGTRSDQYLDNQDVIAGGHAVGQAGTH